LQLVESDFELESDEPSPKKNNTTKSESSKKPKGLAGVEITIHVRRRYEYYLTKIILIFNVVVFMSWGLGFTPHDEIIGRLTMVFTASTAAFAFMYTVQQELPKLAFLTFIDKQMISGILSLAAQAVQAVVSFKADSSFVDSIFAIGIPSLYIIYNTVISINVYRARSEEALHEHREAHEASGMKVRHSAGITIFFARSRIFHFTSLVLTPSPFAVVIAGESDSLQSQASH
jgi:hypothetical protein